MFEETIDDAYNFDVLTLAGKSWYERADASDDHAYLHSGFARIVQHFDHAVVDQTVHLKNHPRFFTRFSIFYFVLDKLSKLLARIKRRNNKMFIITGLVIILIE